MRRRMLLAAVSGSFHRHLSAICEAVKELQAIGVHVLSPADPTIVGSIGAFLFVASDRVRSIRLVQDRHIESIVAADFLWLVSPDGYVGQSASMEVGVAAAKGVPVFSNTLPADLTLRQYVTEVRSTSDAVTRAITLNNRRETKLLIDPHSSIEEAYATLENIRDAFDNRLTHADDAAARIAKGRSRIADLFSPLGTS